MNLAPNKPRLATNTYVTQCKICTCGVYSHQRWHWSVRPLGIVHTHTQCVVTQ